MKDAISAQSPTEKLRVQHVSGEYEWLIRYHGEVLQDLDPISWSHVGYMVKVGGVRDQLVPHLWISQHVSVTITTYQYMGSGRSQNSEAETTAG